jgi:type VI secretion system (T6SS) baseplate-like injector VgrG
MSDDGRYLGKYRGSVFNNIDPENRGRIQAFVPDVLGLTPSTYALPAQPVAGRQSGMFCVPELNAAVWIEFEQGDPDYPIWTGCFWGSAAEVPLMGLASVPVSPNIVLESSGHNSLTLSSTAANGIILSAGPVGAGPSIAITSAGILIKFGTSVISLSATGIDIVGQQITLNGTALVVK